MHFINVNTLHHNFIHIIRNCDVSENAFYKCKHISSQFHSHHSQTHQFIICIHINATIHRHLSLCHIFRHWHCNTLQHTMLPRVAHCVAVLLQCVVAVCCSVLQCIAVCCSVLKCVAVCCSVLQCV